ncbi:hypothetical protein GCM10007877_13860 [Marinibactrum halimedae]|uniref:Haemolysin activator HlyB C-terminal domain-containing protein n=2 Tax=Marinibactrum halimedae TaxID=1444977 RepID=A0AA37WP54_9GAMM|nr:hypothetical protein GCM10007877_13860 [Marinibactrum halimedae]
MQLANRLRQKYPAKMRFDQIQEISDTLTLHLRDAGYKFHYAYIPPQKPHEGNITIFIAEIVLSDISVMNDTFYSSDHIQKQFKTLLNEPLYQPRIDRVLHSLKNIGSMNVFAYYSRGSKPNSVRLNLKVSASERWNMSVSFDNYGPVESGGERGLAQFTMNDPLNRFDRLGLGVLQSYGEEKNQYGYLFYQTPIGNLHHELGLYLSNSAFEIGGEFANLELEGEASFEEVSYTNYVYYSQYTKHFFELTYADKANDFSSVFESDDVEPDESTTVTGISWNTQYSGKRSYHRFLGRWNSGDFSLNGYVDSETGDTTVFESDFDYFNLFYQYYRRFTLASTAWALEGELRAQASSNTRLPSFERMSLTGARGIRGFEAGQFSADDAVISSFALHLPRYQFGGGETNKPFSINTQLFVEGATGAQFDLDGNEVNNAQFIGAGAELSVFWQQHLGLTVTYAFPVSSSSDLPIEFKEQPLTFSLTAKW